LLKDHSPIEEAEGHRRLAFGLMATAALSRDATEWETRNAMSRGYYAVFHMCQALLALLNVTRPPAHRALRPIIKAALGEAYGQRLENFRDYREDADYNPWMLDKKEYRGDLDRFRYRAHRKLIQMKAEFERYSNRIGEEERRNGNSDAD
jgi:uncharacterized protein (UPF0332 family)